MATDQKILKRWTDGMDMFSGMLRTMWGDPNAWEASIRRFEAEDRRSLPPADCVVFTGSSSITFWATLEQDLAPLRVINRGFGGSRVNDVVHYADRVVIPYHPRAVVLFVGTNDIAWPRPASAQQVYDGYRAFVDRVRAALPETPIYFVSITPTPLRWSYWPIVQEANRLIQAKVQTDALLRFIELTDAILAPNGRPDRSLFRADRLHPNHKGYARWTAVIKPILLADLTPEPPG
jgi:lysophospholipase L1-like esterase